MYSPWALYKALNAFFTTAYSYPNISTNLALLLFPVREISHPYCRFCEKEHTHAYSTSRGFGLDVWLCEESSQFGTREVCILNEQARSHAALIIYFEVILYLVLRNIKSVCSSACSAVVLCAFDITCSLG